LVLPEVSVVISLVFAGLLVFFPLLFLVAIVLLIVWAVGGFRRRGDTPTNSEPAGSQGALDILKARYARGEITKEQYDEMKRTLME
jgi:putative membrane protein